MVFVGLVLVSQVFRNTKLVTPKDSAAFFAAMFDSGLAMTVCVCNMCVHVCVHVCVCACVCIVCACVCVCSVVHHAAMGVLTPSLSRTLPPYSTPVLCCRVWVCSHFLKAIPCPSHLAPLPAPPFPARHRMANSKRTRLTSWTTTLRDQPACSRAWTRRICGTKVWGKRGLCCRPARRRHGGALALYCQPASGTALLPSACTCIPACLRPSFVVAKLCSLFPVSLSMCDRHGVRGFEAGDHHSVLLAQCYRHAGRHLVVPGSL